MKCFICTIGVILTLFSATAETTPIVEPITPFSASGTEVLQPVRVIKGKSITRLVGSSIELICYSSGTPQLQSTESGKRVGGFSVVVDGKNQKGVCAVENDIIRYKFPANGEMVLRLVNKKIAVKLNFPRATKLELHMPLHGGFIGGTTLDIDGRDIVIPVFSGKAKIKYSRLFSGSAKNIIFKLDSSGSGFSINPVSKTQIKIGCFYKNKYIDLCVKPMSSGQTIDFTINPGIKKNDAAKVPQHRITRIGSVDFWAYDRYCLPDTRGKNLLQNSSFEQGMRYLMFRQFLRGRLSEELWRVKPIQINNQEAKFGNKSLCILSDNSKRNLRQFITTQSIPLTPGKYTLSAYAKTSRPGHQKLELYVVDPGQLYNRRQWPQKAFELTENWQRYSFSFTINSLQAVPVVFSSRSDREALCFIDGVKLERGSQPTEYQPPAVEGILSTSATDNLVEYGKPVAARLDIITTPGTKGKVKVLVRDFFDTKKLCNTYHFSGDKTGHARVELPLDKLPRGIFVVETDYELENGTKRYEIQRFAIMSFLDNTHKNKNLFVNTYVDPWGTQQIYPEVLDRYKKIGIGARSGFVNRSSLLAKEAAKYGVKSSICRIGNPYGRKNEPGRKIHYLDNIEWYLIPGMNAEKALLVDDWRLTMPHVNADYLKKVVEASRHITSSSPEIKAWCNLVEPEGTMPDLANPAYAKPENFMDFVKLECAVGRGVKSGNPRAMLVNSISANISTPDRRMYFDSLLKQTSEQGLRYDGIAAHIYRPAPEYPGEGLETDFERLFAIMNKYGYDKTPVLCPEGMHWLPVRCYKSPFVQDYAAAGLSGVFPYTYDLSYAEKLGSALRARTWLLGLKLQQRVKQMSAGNYGCFAMDAMLTPYAFQKIPNTLGNLLGNAVFKYDFKLFPDTRCYVFEDEKQCPVAVLWACSQKYDRGKVKAPEFSFKPVGKLRLFDLMEAEHSASPGTNGLVRLPLSPFPVFLCGAPNTMNKFTAMLKSGHFKSMIPIRPQLTWCLISPGQIKVTVTNPYSSQLNGTISFRSVLKECNIAPGQSVDYNFKLPVQLSSKDVQLLVLQFKLQLKNPDLQVFNYSGMSSSLLAKKAPGKIIIDGKLDDWTGIPSLPINRRLRGKMLQRSGKFPSNADFSATYQLCWTSEKLYLAVTVTDNKIGYKSRLLRNGWRNDSLQIFFDTFADGHDSGEPTFGSDDWEYGIFLKDAGGLLSAYRYRTPDVQLTRGTAGAKPGTVARDVESAFFKTENGYVYELAFSIDSIMPFQLRPGNVMGLGILLNDSDDTTEQEPVSRLTNATSNISPNNRPDLWPLVMLINK